MNETTASSADALRVALATWKETVERELKGASFDKRLVTRTSEGVALQPLYTRLDLAGVPDLAARPGQSPYLRGVRPLGYKERGWEVAQEITASSPAEFNRAILANLMHGQNSVVLSPDLAGGTHASAGVAVTRLADLAAALQGVDLSAVPVHLRAGAEPLPLAALYLAHTRARGLAWEKLSGSLTADPLAAWAAAGRPGAGIGAGYD